MTIIEFITAMRQIEDLDFGFLSIGICLMSSPETIEIHATLEGLEKVKKGLNIASEMVETGHQEYPVQEEIRIGKICIFRMFNKGSKEATMFFQSKVIREE